MVCIVRRSAEEDDDIDEPSARPGLTDVEDLGGVVAANRGGKGAAGGGVAIVEKPKRMLNDRLAASLTKQGYKLVGSPPPPLPRTNRTSLVPPLVLSGHAASLRSHSGVKLCRWTKAMLRGRGGCYKHTFYGIASYQARAPSGLCAHVLWNPPRLPRLCPARPAQGADDARARRGAVYGSDSVARVRQQVPFRPPPPPPPPTRPSIEASILLLHKHPPQSASPPGLTRAARRCVFCWRHHKNPVGTTWRWETDDPRLLVRPRPPAAHPPRRLVWG